MLPRWTFPFFAAFILLATKATAQSIAVPWSGHGHDAQHSGLSLVASQSLNQIHWQAPVDFAPQYSGTALYAHYGSPIISRQNTVFFPVKTGPDDGFRIEARSAATGTLTWLQTTDYSLPAHGWVPSCGLALTPKNRLYYPGAGGTVYFRDTPDAPGGATGQLAFYGLGNYNAAQATFNANVKINTPLTTDRYGNIYFGFQVTGPTTPALQSGIARIAEDGAGTWQAASAAADDGTILKVVMNCAPALSNDHKTLYVAVSVGNYSGGYLVALDASTLAPISRVRLKDVRTPDSDANLLDDGTSSPTIGPDGDVYFGVFENPPGSHNYRGWLLHYDATLSQAKPAGAFGWDQTPSIVPASFIPSYLGSSKYLLLSKYNDYAIGGSGGQNKVAILDPNETMLEASTGAAIMKEVLTMLGPTADAD